MSDLGRTGEHEETNVAISVLVADDNAHYRTGIVLEDVLSEAPGPRNVAGYHQRNDLIEAGTALVDAAKAGKTARHIRFD